MYFKELKRKLNYIVNVGKAVLLQNLLYKMFGVSEANFDLWLAIKHKSSQPKKLGNHIC